MVLKVTIAGGQLLDMDEHAGDIPFFLFGDIPIRKCERRGIYQRYICRFSVRLILCGLCLLHMPGKWEIVCG